MTGKVEFDQKKHDKKYGKGNGDKKLKALKDQAKAEREGMGHRLDAELVQWAIAQLEFAIRCGQHHRPSEVVQAMGEWVSKEEFNKVVR